MDGNTPHAGERIRSDRIAIGRVRKPFGLKGQFYTDAFGKGLGALTVPCGILCGHNEEGATSVVLSEKRETPKGFICKFEGNDTIEEATRVRGAYLFLEKSDLPELKNNEYYHFELKGMTVVTSLAGKQVGVVTEMQSFPTVDALSVRRDDGSTVLIAMNKGNIEKIDREKRCIIVNESILQELIE